MRPTTTGAAAPPGSALPSPKPGATTRQRKLAAGAPLSDVTNLLRLPDTPAPVKLRRTARRPLPDPAPSAASSTCSSTASVTPAPAKRPSAAVLEGESSVFKSPAISTAYARRGAAAEAQAGRRRKHPTTTTITTTTTTTTTTITTTATNKGKEPVASAAAGTASCPPLGRSTRKSRKETMAQDPRSISSSAPCPKVKKKRPSPSTPKLPEDFVKKQRAYFADIDAFELPEEEVSESELD